MSWISIAIAILFQSAVAFSLIPKGIKLGNAFQTSGLLSKEFYTYLTQISTLHNISCALVFLSLLGVSYLCKLTTVSRAPVFWTILVGVLDLFQMSTNSNMLDFSHQLQPTNGQLVGCLKQLQISTWGTLGAIILFMIWHAWAPRKSAKS